MPNLHKIWGVIKCYFKAYNNSNHISVHNWIPSIHWHQISLDSRLFNMKESWLNPSNFWKQWFHMDKNPRTPNWLDITRVFLGYFFMKFEIHTRHRISNTPMLKFWRKYEHLISNLSSVLVKLTWNLTANG